ncbi:thiamine pyrophosphate-dependent enzyme [Phenylobacterium sp.]|jgi:thiamine pyrophosphate-dependent acetolactate synthase large subunit-like protein|uniref:thiamine pyrophosphate-dependent enzyme n=1 Tax=Phenylobacterium sp. TaxID=1871053 RepID=UPI002F3E8A1E
MDDAAAKPKPDPTAADLLIDSLIDWGIDTVFGLPGDGINGIMEALRTRQAKIRFIQARHEEAAAFMACAYAKWTGRIGCCLATTGPGGVHLLNGLYDAKFDRAPVLAITGLPYHDLAQTSTQQDIDHVRLFNDVAEHAAAITGAAQVEGAVALACRTALARRGVTHLAVPVDVQEQTLSADKRSPRNKARPTKAYAESPHAPDPEAVGAAAEILKAGRRVLILAGQGAFGAEEDLLRVAERLGAPIAKALLGKAVVPDDHPYVTGGVGYLGARPSQLAMDACDTLLIVGSGFPYVEYYPEPGQAKVVQIDVDPARIGLRYPVDAALVGDAAACLQALTPHLPDLAERGFLARAQAWKQEWLEALDTGADRSDVPMKPQRVVRDLNRRLPDHAVIAADCGHNTGLTAQYVQIRQGQAFGVSGTLASMGGGVPYAIAAALAFPGRPVVAVVGDGGLSMSLAELATCARYRLPVKVIVLNNGTLGQIKWEQMLFLGNPEFACDLQPIDFAKVAQAMGVKAWRIEDPNDCARVLDEALAHEGPALVDAVVDPDEPMLPPKRRPEYMEKLEKALAAGTPHAAEITQALGQEPARTSLKP